MLLDAFQLYKMIKLYFQLMLLFLSPSPLYHLCVLTHSTFCFIFLLVSMLNVCRSSGEDFVCPATECLRGHPMPLYPVCLQIKVKDRPYAVAQSTLSMCSLSIYICKNCELHQTVRPQQSKALRQVSDAFQNCGKMHKLLNMFLCILVMEVNRTMCTTSLNSLFS